MLSESGLAELQDSHGLPFMGYTQSPHRRYPDEYALALLPRAVKGLRWKSEQAPLRRLCQVGGSLSSVEGTLLGAIGVIPDIALLTRFLAKQPFT
jgi:hypothetical protein